MSLAAKIEAILYLKGQAVSVSELAELAQCERAEVKDALIQLMSDYARRDTALEVIETTNGYSLQLREAYSDLMDSLVPPELGVGALRTLAVIALKGGISQTDLVELRGSGAYQQVQELVEMGFVRKRRQPETRSYWLQVTSKFHQYFQLDQLPQQLSFNFPSSEASDVMTDETDPGETEETQDTEEVALLIKERVEEGTQLLPIEETVPAPEQFSQAPVPREFSDQLELELVEKVETLDITNLEMETDPALNLSQPEPKLAE